MRADQEKKSPTGLKGLVGHLLHDLPCRLFQLVRAIWTFLIGTWAPPALSLLPSGWVVHRSVQPEEVLEALGLHSWERLGECYEELGQEPGLAESWKEFSSIQDRDSFDLAIEELTTWQKAMIESNFKVLWEALENDCHYETSVDHTLSSDDLTRKEKNGSQLREVASRLFHVKSDEVLSWIDEKDDRGVNAFVGFPSKDEVIRSPRKDESCKKVFVDFPSQDEVKRSPRIPDSSQVQQEFTSKPVQDLGNFPRKYEVERSPRILESSQVQQELKSKPVQDLSNFPRKDEVERSPWLLQSSQVQKELTSKLKQDFGLSRKDEVMMSHDEPKNDFVDCPSQDEVKRSPRILESSLVQQELMSKLDLGDLLSKDQVERSPRLLEPSQVQEVLPFTLKQDIGLSSKDEVERSLLDSSQIQEGLTSKPVRDHGDLSWKDLEEWSPQLLDSSLVQEKLTSKLKKDCGLSSKDEVRRLPQFQEQSQVHEELTSKPKQVSGEMEHADTHKFLAPIQCTPMLQLSPPAFEGHQSQLEKSCNQPELLKAINLSNKTILELAGIDEEYSYGIRELDTSGGPQHNCPPSPEKDQGYYSLEDWQCLEFTQYIQTIPVETQETCSTMSDHLQAPSLTINHEREDQKDELDPDLGDIIPTISVPTCTNKHIGYILGTIVSDDEDEDLSSDDEDEESDDGFDSEGSVSSTDSETSCPEETVNWGSFSSSDPYSLQNFTANLQTGSASKETLVLPQDPPRSDDEESWCDSEVESDSEEDCSADEEENQKLWNAFLKSEDPYNPLHFKAVVQSTERKRQSPETSRKKLEITCINRIDLPSCPEGEPKHLAFKDGNRTRPAHKKVTFLENVTVYIVCNQEERKGHWEELARDRCRFQRRIQETESTIGHCFSPSYRKRVWMRMQEQWGS